MLPSATCSEEYARQRIENSPLRNLFLKTPALDSALSPTQKEEKLMLLDTKNYKCAQAALASLIIRLHYKTDLKLDQIREQLVDEVKSLCAVDMAYVINTLATAQLENPLEEEVGEEEEEELGDGKDREEEEEEEEGAEAKCQ